MSAEYVPLTMEQIEVLVEEVIEANSVWPDPINSQVPAVMNVLREAMAQAWDEGFKQGGPMHDVNYDDPDAHRCNPYRKADR